MPHISTVTPLTSGTAPILKKRKINRKPNPTVNEGSERGRGSFSFNRNRDVVGQKRKTGSSLLTDDLLNSLLEGPASILGTGKKRKRKSLLGSAGAG